eukprot:34454_6
MWHETHVTCPPPISPPLSLSLETVLYVNHCQFAAFGVMLCGTRHMFKALS